MGRPLRPLHRARRRQPDGAEDADHARRRDGAGPRPRHPADGARPRRGKDPVRAAAAVRRQGARADRGARARRLAGQRRQLLGPQRHHPHPRFRGILRAAGPSGQEAVRRADPVARFRRGRADVPRRLARRDGAPPRRVMGGEPALADRHGGARPPLGAGQPAARQGACRARPRLAEPRASRARHRELLRLAHLAAPARLRLRAERAGALHPARNISPTPSSSSPPGRTSIRSA